MLLTAHLVHKLHQKSMNYSHSKEEALKDEICILAW